MSAKPPLTKGISKIFGKLNIKDMQIKIFTIPILADENMINEMNHFLKTVNVIDIRKEIVQNNGSIFWSFCITYIPYANSNYLEDNKKKDAFEKLSSVEFARFVELKKIRKNISMKEAIPAYMI